MADAVRPPSPARVVAARTLARVWDAAAFASVALDAEIRRTRLDARDAALATELVYGVLRTENVLTAWIEEVASRGRLDLEGEARAHLLCGAFSVSFLDRVPAFAAVSEAVAGVTHAGDVRIAPFANAVLRRLAERAAKKRPDLAAAVVASAPGWLRGALRRSLGRSGAEQYLAAGPIPPPLGLAVAPGEDREAVVARLRAAAPGATVEPAPVSPIGILVRGAGDPRKLPGAGASWIVMEEGSQIVALSLGARPGERVLDACAGHGNKSWVLRGSIGASGAVDAADLSADKLDALARAVPGVCARYVVDWMRGTGDVPADYDRALVDAPCSGIGTLRRRPEIARRRTEGDLERLTALQGAIVRSVATRVREGGTLVLSVCSVLREEAEAVVEKVTGPIPGAHARALEPAPFDFEPASTLASGQASFRLAPHVHGTDGYFVARFVVK